MKSSTRSCSWRGIEWRTTSVLRELNYGDLNIPYEVTFLPSRKSLTIEVHPDGSVKVRVPVGTDELVIAKRVQRRAKWITRQLNEFASYRPKTPARQYVSGETHLYLGRRYRLRPTSGSEVGVKLTRGELRVSTKGSATPENIRSTLTTWQRARAREVFNDVLSEVLPRFKGIDSPRIQIRTMRSRWGSLSQSGTMTLNVDLIRAPRMCVEYVVTHELCHAKHRSHDTKFYKLLSQKMPDWEKRKRKLESALL